MSDKWENTEQPVEQTETPVDLPPPEAVEAAAAEPWVADLPPPPPPDHPPSAPPVDGMPAAAIEEPETAEPPVEYASVREALLANIDNPSLRNHASELYRESATTGDGGTAAALFHEKDTGDLVGGKPHEGKALNRSNGLRNVLEDEGISITDREIAKDLKEDLDNARAYTPPAAPGGGG